MALFGSSETSSSDSSTELKKSLMQQVQAEAAMSNARLLVAKINENCFERCIPSPGSSLSAGENTCLSSCMEKYISAWNLTSRTYVARVQSEAKKMGASADVLGGL
ncbi:putative mitochondrial intermembrane space translocase subunit Tim13 [Talaromyces proteolyticus]|uniref:Mitochondrial import inner membrane translocase subunit n=1 Tax=Talaromyces proteolyticus TaxID=1131652 RepID=A0AAD4L6Y5_9EURO|nr:putative mitochondrial intermembrane space translocase subunit Tim13 [Talaromyces proteolyticus]KAH8705725.1 putative mitochondrial intermembrane space translocase subunit Tim13 [Talaromyces proteolyticus]